MVYGKLGVTPLVLHAKSRMIMFWARIYKSSSIPKLSNILYQFIFDLYNRNIYISPRGFQPWKIHWKVVFFSGVWDNQLIPENINSFKKKLQQRIKDQFFHHWTSEINLSRKCLNYRMFTTTLNLKTYLVNLSYRERGITAKSRCRNHNFPIESGCRQNIPHNLRICELCTQDIGDEFHYIFQLFSLWSHTKGLNKKTSQKLNFIS